MKIFGYKHSSLIFPVCISMSNFLALLSDHFAYFKHLYIERIKLSAICIKMSCYICSIIETCYMIRQYVGTADFIKISRCFQSSQRILMSVISYLNRCKRTSNKTKIE